MPKLLNEHLGARSSTPTYSRIVPQTVEEEEALDPHLAELQLYRKEYLPDACWPW